ncbi:predicted protein [Sclerotinia sclerotiorum 1980 UF-70]|uniref:Uncharacterized protein n=2 Tax=Sclerotinia sclerotiorum (strain ATCC 18683 / 1980 / Ss-1) TaxID=665079 RepID=A7E6D2_SCLS1|nr:predicted protein [Sclerotinia sclerotiorum 1980 UF-70]APA07624.1 hypothetical protein sscle_03g023940 [Sclerotinia sclerotiorum 1980 UF-70]EDN91454.1 predicted protein [Sclerotinia sclerotiorum 1980 UF-70]
MAVFFGCVICAWESGQIIKFLNCFWCAPDIIRGSAASELGVHSSGSTLST